MTRPRREPRRRHKLAGRLLRRGAQVGKGVALVSFYTVIAGLIVLRMFTRKPDPEKE